MSVTNIEIEDSRKKYVQSNRHYSRLIESVGVFGVYQKQLIAIVIASWFVTGLYEAGLFTFYDLGDPDCLHAIPKDLCIINMCNEQSNTYFPSPRRVPDTIPYNLHIPCEFSLQFLLSNVAGLSQFCGLLLVGWIATKNGKQKLMILLGFFLLIGTLTLMFNKQSIIGIIIAQTFIGLSCSPISILLLTMIPELMTEKHTIWVIALSAIANKLGRIVMAGIFSSGCELALIVLAVQLPICIIYFAIHCYLYESPRHLMDNDILKAFEVLKKIAHKNNSQCEQIDIENSFVMSKIKRKRYDYTSLFKHRSLRIQTYAYCWIMLTMGILSQYPSYVMEVRLSRGYQQLVMASIELISLLPTFLFVIIYPRKIMTIVISSLLFLLCFMLPLMAHNNDMYYMIRVAVLGLACIALSILLVFLTVSIVETYPHTVRTLAMCLLYGCYLLGRCIQKAADYIIEREEVMEEMFAEVAFLMLFHLFAIRQTKDCHFLYEVKELNDEIDEEALLE